MIDNKFDNFLLNASDENIQKLTEGFNPKLPQVYNNLFIKHTTQNSKERQHWIKYCKIIHSMEIIEENNSKILFKFYYKNPNKFYHNEHDIIGRNQCHKILMNIWEYVDNDKLHIYLTKDLFGNNVYDYYEFICKDENINKDKLYISN